jgi:hypothetical protein
MESATKVCALCGCDCTSRPRVKDGKGRYYCRECYDRAKQTAQRPVARAGPLAAAATALPRTGEPPRRREPADAMAELLRAEQAPESASRAVACPGCGAAISGGVICVACGYDTRTGKRLAMRVDSGRGSAAAEAAASVAAAGARALRGTAEFGRPLLFGMAGGVIGAVVWAAVAYGLGLQRGWIAIGVGALVGFGVRLGGGCYPVHGLLAAGIAVVAICAGKVAAVNLVIRNSPEFRKAVSGQPLVREMMNLAFSQEVYEEIKQNAQAFRKVKDKSGYAAFLVERGICAAAKPEDVTPEDIADFEADGLPVLQRFIAEDPSYEQWKTQEKDLLMKKVSSEVASEASLKDMLKASLGIFDILFFLLAIGAAYRIPAGQGILET